MEKRCVVFSAGVNYTVNYIASLSFEEHSQQKCQRVAGIFKRRYWQKSTCLTCLKCKLCLWCCSCWGSCPAGSGGLTIFGGCISWSKYITKIHFDYCYILSIHGTPCVMEPPCVCIALFRNHTIFVCSKHYFNI